jgi:quercetin dioxygenase-like cupin family protein
MSVDPAFHFVADLAGAITVPEQGTLSVPVFQDDSTKALLFAFSAGQELSEHTAAVPATIQLISGRATWTLGKEVVEAKAGSWAQMDAHLPHSITAHEPTVMLLVMNRAAKK